MNNTLENPSEAADQHTDTEMKSPAPVEHLLENAEPATTRTANASTSGGNSDKELGAAKVGAHSTTLKGNDIGIENKVQYNEISVNDTQADKLSDITHCEDALSVAEEFMAQASELIGEVIDGDDLEIDKESALNNILLSLKDAVNAVHKGIEFISRDKLEKETNSIEVAVKAMGYKDLDTFIRKIGYAKNANTINVKDPSVNSPPLVQSASITNKKAGDPYDFLLKEEFTGTGKPDFTKGYYRRYGIKPITGWAKDFNNVHGRPPTPEDCRDATVEEKDAMRIANQHAFDSIKRRSRSPKKQ